MVADSLSLLHDNAEQCMIPLLSPHALDRHNERLTHTVRIRDYQLLATSRGGHRHMCTCSNHHIGQDGLVNGQRSTCSTYATIREGSRPVSTIRSKVSGGKIPFKSSLHPPGYPMMPSALTPLDDADHRHRIYHPPLEHLCRNAHYNNTGGKLAP